MPYQMGLPAALAARGLSVETVPGWETRGSASFTPRGVVCHWTAGPRTGDRPSLSVVTHGRAGLPGPLAQVVLSRAGVAVVVAAGRANHAGAGGWRGLSGNTQVFGIEAECSGDGGWTEAQRAAYPRVVAALCDLARCGPDMVCGHHEWAPSRKIDIRDWPMSLMRTQVGTLLTGGTPAPGPTPTPPPAPAARNQDGSLRLAVDGSRGPATIARWQEVMGTPIDGRISTPSTLIRADQDYLNGELAAHLGNLIGGKLAIDGREGPKTVRARQFLLYNRHAQAVLGRSISLGADVDGHAGPETTRLHQHALNQATARTGGY